MSSNLTNNNFIYLSFSKVINPAIPVSSPLDVENFFGIVRFDMSEPNADALHKQLVDYCLDNNVKIAKTLEVNWNDLSKWDISGCQFYNNYRNWIITTFLGLEVLFACIEKAEEDATKIEFYL